MDTISDTVASATRALDGLRDVFDRLNSSIAESQKQRTIEGRLGRLFIKAQAFVDDVRAETAEWVERTRAEAEAEAADIVASARREAERILHDAHRPNISPEALQQLKATIRGFNQANADLADELNRLNSALGAEPQSLETRRRRVTTDDGEIRVTGRDGLESPRAAPLTPGSRGPSVRATLTAFLSGPWAIGPRRDRVRPRAYRWIHF